jgi:hypothetical protein
MHYMLLYKTGYHNEEVYRTDGLTVALTYRWTDEQISRKTCRIAGRWNIRLID